MNVWFPGNPESLSNQPVLPKAKRSCSVAQVCEAVFHQEQSGTLTLFLTGQGNEGHNDFNPWHYY